MEQNLLQLGALAVIFALAIREFFGWLKSRKNGGIDLSVLDAMNARLKDIGNDNHHEVVSKLDNLIEINNKQLYILEDIKESLKK